MRNKIFYENTGGNKMVYTIIMDYYRKSLGFNVCLKSETATP